MKVLSPWSSRRSDMGRSLCLSSAPSFVFHLFHPVQLSLRPLQQQTAKPHTSLRSSHYCWCITRRPVNWNLNTADIGIGDSTVTSTLRAGAFCFFIIFNAPCQHYCQLYGKELWFNYCWLLLLIGWDLCTIIALIPVRWGIYQGLIFATWQAGE